MHFHDRDADTAVRWAEIKLAQLIDRGRERQAAVNEILTEVTRQWGADCERAVEISLHIHFEPALAPALADSKGKAARS